MIKACQDKKKSTGKGKVTLQNIADVCEVNIATVSKVLNNKNNFSIRPEKRRMILARAKELGYRPNVAARNLRLKRTNQIMIHGFDMFYGHVTSTYPEMLNAFLASVNDRGYQANMVFPASNNQLTSPLALDGALFIKLLDFNLIDEFKTGNIPFVLLNDRLPDTSWVSVDDYHGMQLALNHLFAKGHRNIAYRCHHSEHKRLINHHSVEDRHKSYLDWMGQHQLKPHTDFGFEFSTEEFLEDIVADKITGVVVYSYTVALRLYEECVSQGIRIPEDLSIVTFDYLSPRASGPQITSVRKPLVEMGKCAADMLIRQIEGNHKQEQIIFPLELCDKGTAVDIK